MNNRLQGLKKIKSWGLNKQETRNCSINWLAVLLSCSYFLFLWGWGINYFLIYVFIGSKFFFNYDFMMAHVFVSENESMLIVYQYVCFLAHLRR